MIVDGKEYLTVSEAVKLLGITRQAVNYKIQQEWANECIDYKIGNSHFWLIPKSIIDTYSPRKQKK